MVNPSLIESIIVNTALAMLECLCWTFGYGCKNTPREPVAVRTNYGRAVLEVWFRDALLPKLISGKLRLEVV